MKIKIITHERVVFDGEADEIIGKAKDGEFGILQNHVPPIIINITIYALHQAA